MECQFKKVNTNEEDDDREEFDRKIFLRQLFVSSGSWVQYFTCGLYLGAPTVFIPQIRKDANSTDAVSDDMASWISSGCSYGAIPWIFILTILLTVIGRKKTCIIISIASILISIIFYCGNTPNQLLTFQILQGLPYAGTMAVSITVLAEYTSPKYRGMFLLIKTATVYWGIWVSNTIGAFAHWKYISMVGLVFSMYSLTACLWPESPFYLVSKGKFEECKKSHRWLKGTGNLAEKELENLIISQSNINAKCDNLKINIIRRILNTLFLRQFYKPLMVCCLCISMYFFSGKIVYTIYAIEIIKKITNNESAAYTGMLILDAATVSSMYMGCCLSKILKRRTLLFCSSSVAILFLFSLSIYLYCVKLSIISENKYVSILLLTGFCFSVSCGPVIMSTSLCGELTPLNYKSLSLIIVSLVFASLQAILLKISPFIFNVFKMHGTFLFYGICMSLCTTLLYKCLPETKDKTLQEIEEYFKDSKSREEKKLVNKIDLVEIDNVER